MITAALVAVGLLAVALVPAQAQQQGTVVVPAPARSASPGTTVTPPSATVGVALQPWCAGAYSSMGGSNFGSCPGVIPR